MKIKLNLPALTVFFLSLFMSSFSCSDSKTPSPNPNPNMEIEGQNSPYISLDASQLNTQEFQLAPITIQNINSFVHAVGTLAVPPENQEEVSVFFEGNLSEIYLLPGAQVNKGDVLFWVKGPAYIEIQEAFLKSKESLEVVKKDFERIQTLYPEKLLSD
jgi:cobalt-zinc-cadmium efflux system membrane fusion protein